VGSGSPTLYNSSCADLVNAGSCGLGFSTALRRRAGGLSYHQAATAAPSAISGLPPNPIRPSPTTNNADQGDAKKIQGDFSTTWKIAELVELVPGWV